MVTNILNPDKSVGGKIDRGGIYPAFEV
jgi:hypothetical protein